MDSVTGVADFRVVDPPRVSPRPVVPSRLELLAMVLFGALAAGIAASYAASQVWPVFFDSKALREVTGLPVLGGVSFQQTEENRSKERRGLLAFASVLGSLIAVFGMLIAMLYALSARAV
jgi:uncharacterized protein involved in exopolysaccharide biosynthesis